MKRSERILLALLVVGVLIWLGRGPAARLFYEPIEQLDSQIAMIDRQIAQRELEELQLLSAAKDTKSWKRLSLPPDPLTAQRLYQSWLTDLAVATGLGELKITPEARNPAGKAFVAVQVRLNAEGTLSQILTFLQKFYRSELLHRINSLDLDSDVSGKSPVISMTLVAEGLSLTSAPPRNWLFPQTTLVDSIQASEATITVKNASDFPDKAGFLISLQEETLRVIQMNGNSWTVERGYASGVPDTHQAGTIVQLMPVSSWDAEAAEACAALIAANPFLRPVASVALVRAPDQEIESGIDEAEYTYLISAIADAEDREAWLFNRLNNTKLVIKEGEPFRVAGIDGILLKIQQDFVLVSHRGATWRLNVGDNLRALQRQGN